jgi:hypothetical protein
LCRLESHLLSDLARTDWNADLEILSSHTSLPQNSSPQDVVLHLRRLPADTRSDDFLAALLRLLPNHRVLVESLIILAFLPLLHRTVRLVSLQQRALSPEDTAQEAVTFLLEFLCSEGISSRRSHFAFAISREIKRHVFTWAKRESRKTAVLADLSDHVDSSLGHDAMERFVELRHFLDRALRTGNLTEAELNLLVDFKLNGGDSDGAASNATRQRLKRLLARLRSLANSASVRQLSTQNLHPCGLRDRVPAIRDLDESGPYKKD